ncbi:Card1-like endonuclease domain-containing protein [Chitinibacteraceae bacterium HSL-7]
MHLISLVGHICTDLVSPALDRAFGIARVTLLYDPMLGDEVHRVAQICRDAGLPTNVLPLRPRYDPETISQRLDALVRNGPSLINLSGASAVQASVATRIALTHGTACFAIEPDADTTVWLVGDGVVPDGHNVADAMKLDSYFTLFGATLLRADSRLERRNLQLEHWSRRMAKLATEEPEAIYHLNVAGSTLDADHISVRPIRRLSPALATLLDESELAYVTSDQRIAFASHSAHRFLHGGWLERYVFAEAAELIGQRPIQDLACGARIRVDDVVDNEFDVAILCNNQLYLIECKTVLGDSIDRATLFKLDSVTGVGGLNAEAMLATLALPNDSDVERAGVHDIALIGGNQLLETRHMLREWLG